MISDPSGTMWALGVEDAVQNDNFEDDAISLVARVTADAECNTWYQIHTTQCT